MVFVTKYRNKKMFAQLCAHLGERLYDLATRRESEVLEGHVMNDRVHMLMSVSPDQAVSQAVGYIKGKSAIHIAQTYVGVRRHFVGPHFWARGYLVSMVGWGEDAICDDIKKHEAEGRRMEQQWLK